MLRRTTVGLILTLLLAPAPTQAECILHTAKFVMTEPTIELVFSGQVIEIIRVGDFGSRATFDVNRVWKGSVPKRFDLYVWERSAEMPRFQKGQRYVALGKTLTEPRIRQDLGLAGSDTVVFAATQCSDPQSLSPDIERELGPGYGPKRDQPQRRTGSVQQRR